MPAATRYPLRIFYDGSCGLCAGKMTYYRRQDRHGRFAFIDISDRSFTASAYDIPLAALRYELHVIDGNGSVYRGVAAFRAIWQALPAWRYRLLAALVSLPGIALLARLIYRSVAATRHVL